MLIEYIYAVIPFPLLTNTETPLNLIGLIARPSS